MKETGTERILITGAHGFIGRNVGCWLQEKLGAEILEFVRGDSVVDLERLVLQADKIVHLAGENRPSNAEAFNTGNIQLTKTLCDVVANSGLKIPLVFVSSSQAGLSNPYGQSKLAAEDLVRKFADKTKLPVTILRLPGIFGKWSRPNYNSVVATFCFNIARGYEVEIHDKDASIELAYIDDLNHDIIVALSNETPGLSFGSLSKTYEITVGELAEQIHAFKRSRQTLVSERVGTGLIRALYSTYVSFLPTDKFTYSLPKHGDERGIFVEMLKTPDCGQFSFFTLRSGLTRGSHYHHSKSEKFLVVNGIARMRYRHLISQEIFEINVSGDNPEVVDTIPGWVHDIKNIGDSELIVMLWANEIFDHESPDTISQQV